VFSAQCPQFVMSKISPNHPSSRTLHRLKQVQGGLSLQHSETKESNNMIQDKQYRYFYDCLQSLAKFHDFSTTDHQKQMEVLTCIHNDIDKFSTCLKRSLVPLVQFLRNVNRGNFFETLRKASKRCSKHSAKRCLNLPANECSYYADLNALIFFSECFTLG
jgi:hypothetical protein